MMTIDDIVNEIAKIRDVADQIEVRGKQNAAILCYVYDKCNELIASLKQTAAEIQRQNQNGSEPEIITTEGGEEIGV